MRKSKPERLEPELVAVVLWIERKFGSLENAVNASLPCLAKGCQDKIAIHPRDSEVNSE